MDLYNEERLEANYYLKEGLKHYIDFQNDYYEALPVQWKPLDKNRIPLSFFFKIISHLAERNFETSAIYDECIEKAIPHNKFFDLEAMFFCPHCKKKYIGKVIVRTNRDQMELVNLVNDEQINLSAVSEFMNTKEKIKISIHFFDDFFEGNCSLDNKHTMEQLHNDARLCIVLTEELINYLKR